jgi:hypothetical protein
MERPQGAQAFEWFKTRVEQDAALHGVMKDKNVEHHVNLLLEAVNRAIFNIENKIQEAPANKDDKAKKFISIFNLGFHKYTKGSVVLPITSAQRVMMDATIKNLERGDGDIEEYITWVFDDFLPKTNGKFSPALSTFLTTFIVQQYFIDMKEKIEKRKKNVLNNVELTDILNRYRTLMRNEKLSEDVRNEIFEAKQQYDSGLLHLLKLKEQIIKTEGIAVQIG